jgi:PP-loop superfamily ATP-utilizing enzyme
MALGQLRLDTKENKIEYAIKLLKDYEPKEGYYLGFSGGKDSVVVYDIAVKSGVKFDAHYCVSPIDPPEYTLLSVKIILMLYGITTLKDSGNSLKKMGCQCVTKDGVVNM